MIEGLKPYAEYKESGQEWLGIVPAHWELKPGLAAFSKRKVLNIGLKEKTVLSLSYGRIKVKAIDKQHGLVPESYETYQIVNEGNLIIRGTDLQNDHTSLRIGLARNRGIISSAYLCLETRDMVSPDYGYQILNAFDITKAIYRYGSGLRQNLDHGEIKRLPIFLPPPDEQAAIVRFLDHANRKIDRFIRAKRKLIGLLDEQKQAIIHHAVTRGLNPDVPLKPSGVPWIGDIPGHWEVRHLRRLCRKIKTGGTPKGADDKFFEDDGFNWYTPSDFRDAIELGDASRRLSKLGIEEVTIFPANTILMIGIGATIGKISISRKMCSCNQQINAILPLRLVHIDYLAYYLRILRNYILSCGKFTTMPIINQDETKRLLVLLPPLLEQEEIAKSIECTIKPFTEGIARTEREIALMQEFRIRLTADIVTGKLDVREAAAKLPDLPPDAAAIDAELLGKTESEEEEDNQINAQDV